MSNSLNQITKFQREVGEKGWQAAEERATRFCNLNTSQRDNSYFIANLLKPSASKAYAILQIKIRMRI